MHPTYRLILQMTFTFAIIFFTLYMTHHFIIPLAWAAVIAITSWPLYLKLKSWLVNHDGLSATLMTLAVVCVVIMPLVWLLWQASQDAMLVVKYLLQANKTGKPVPPWLSVVPLIGRHLSTGWEKILSEPEGLNHFLAGSHFSLAPLSKYAKTIGLKAAHSFTLVFFVVLALFFFYKDGKTICRWLQDTGQYCLGERFALYVASIPNAVRATVVGSVLVGFSVGIVMGLCYLLFSVTAPVLLGLITGILAMIPFGAPVAFILIALVQYLKGYWLSAIVITLVGMVVMFVADHFVRPRLIGDATKLPFLAVLLGIIGGIETMGLIGLFLGPTVMVLLMTLFREPSLKLHADW